MELWLERKILNNTSTEGNLWIKQKDGSWKWLCNTIEDVVRAKPGEWRKALKIYAKTAIPYGRYPVVVTWSNRFQQQMPRIMNVPDFDGILFHWGTTELSSAGCVIISYKDDDSKHKLLFDKAVTYDLRKLVSNAQKTEKVWLTIADKKPF